MGNLLATGLIKQGGRKAVFESCNETAYKLVMVKAPVWHCQSGGRKGTEAEVIQCVLM
jgi:hypothetical protein